MIKRGYFPKGTYIDPTAESLVYPEMKGSEIRAVAQTNGVPGQAVSNEEYVSFICKSCGAANRIQKRTDGECAYCGTIYRFD